MPQADVIFLTSVQCILKSNIWIWIHLFIIYKTNLLNWIIYNNILYKSITDLLINFTKDSVQGTLMTLINYDIRKT